MQDSPTGAIVDLVRLVDELQGKVTKLQGTTAVLYREIAEVQPTGHNVQSQLDDLRHDIVVHVAENGATTH